MTLEENKALNANIDDIVAKAENINNEDVYPLVCLSYKRGSDAATLKILKELSKQGLKCFLFIYDFDAENYREIIEDTDISVQLCSGFQGVVPKRNYINQRMKELGYDRIFVLDDDVKKLYYVRAFEDENKLGRFDKVFCDNLLFFKIWQYYIENYINDFTLCGISFNNESVFCSSSDLVKDCKFNSCLICIDLPSLGDIKYRSGYGWDDIDFFMQIVLSGLKAYSVLFLSSYVGTMTPSGSVANTGDKKWTKLSMQAYKEYGNLMRYTYKYDQVKCKPHRKNLMNYINKTITEIPRTLVLDRAINTDDLELFESEFNKEVKKSNITRNKLI